MSSSNSPCAACKFLRRKCTQECVFAPYFPPDNPQRFACVHRVFGASNVAKLLNELNAAQRDDAVRSLAYEAEARLRDPVYGCVGFISVLQQRLKQIQGELLNAKKELATYVGPQGLPGMSPILPPTAGIMTQPHPGNPYSSPLYPYGNNMAPIMTGASHGGGGGGQLVIREPPPQELFEAQQFAAAAAAAAREQQEMLRSFEQQEEFLRFNTGGGFEVGSSVGGGGGGGGFNQISTPVGPTEMSPSLALGGTFENPYQMRRQQQPQQGEHNPHSHSHHHNYPIEAQQGEHHDHSHPHHHHPIEAQLLLSPQHAQTQSQQPHQQQSELSDEGRSTVGPSC